MAKQIGNKFFVRFDTIPNPTFIICEQNSGIDLSAEIITVLCKTSGDYAEILKGGTRSGSLSFTGAYEKNPSSGNISAFELVDLLGTIQNVVYGGLDAGDDILEFPGHVSNVNITSDTNAAITFTATLTVAGTVTTAKIPT